MTQCTKIYISKPRPGKREPVYTARLGSPNGPIIVESSGEPLLAASRAVLALGHIGRIEMWDAFLPYYRMCGDIETLAQLTLRNGRYEKYRPPPGMRAMTMDQTVANQPVEEWEKPILGHMHGTRKGNR
jgi:hypothetical protein